MTALIVAVAFGFLVGFITALLALIGLKKDGER